jgi:hypothetical protein
MAPRARPTGTAAKAAAASSEVATSSSFAPRVSPILQDFWTILRPHLELTHSDGIGFTGTSSEDIFLNIVFALVSQYPSMVVLYSKHPTGNLY